MCRPVVDRGTLIDALASSISCRVLVVGDLMVDQFVWGEVSRISPEAPVPVVEVQDETLLLGGAANVANNLNDLGAQVTLCGLLGNDEMGRAFRALARARGIDCQAVATTGRPTTLKTRIIARGQQVVRVDREGPGAADAGSHDRLIDLAREAADSADAILVSDYAKGVVTGPLMEFLVDVSRRRDIPLFLDPKPSNLSIYKGISVVTPNEKEAEAMAGLHLSGGASVEDLARRISGLVQADAVLVTRGKHGMVLWRRGRDTLSIPAMAREVFDVTGAGDTVIAALSFGMALGLDLPEASYLANLAAGIVVGKVGTATVKRDEVREFLLSGGDRVS